MPIPQITITPTDFLALQQNVTEQQATFVTCATVAQSGLTLVALLDDVAPTIDLTPGFAAHLQGIEQYNAPQNFTAIVKIMNDHLINRGTVQIAGDNASSRLNRWLDGSERVGQIDLTPIQVTQEYADISAVAGYIIDAGNIAP
jgi:hypothetical protein